LLLKRYGNIDYILNAPFYIGVSFINKASEKERDEQIRRDYLALLPREDGKLMDFAKYREQAIKESEKKQTTKQTPEQQIAMLKALTIAMGGKIVEVTG